jgi:hypothetical protein
VRLVGHQTLTFRAVNPTAGGPIRLGPVVRADGDAPEIKDGHGFHRPGVDTGGLAEEGFGLSEQIVGSRCTAGWPARREVVLCSQLP